MEEVKEKPPPGTVLTNSKGITYVVQPPAPPIREKPPRPEYSIGKYELLRPLGKGKFGSLYEVREINPFFEPIVQTNDMSSSMTNARYAIKMEERESEMSMLQHESTILYALMKHSIPQIPKLYWYGTDDSWRFMTTTLFSGISLQDVIVQETFEWKDILQWFKEACSILRNIHAAGAIHRDIKPVHFLRDNKSNKWNLIDFGLSTFYVNGKQEFLENEPKTNIVGTPNYMSIYIHQGNTPSRRDDMISLIYIFLNAYLKHYFSTELPWICLNRNDFTSDSNNLSNIHHPYNEAILAQKEWKSLYKWLYIQKVESSVLQIVKTAASWTFLCEPEF